MYVFNILVLSDHRHLHKRTVILSYHQFVRLGSLINVYECKVQFYSMHRDHSIQIRESLGEIKHDFNTCYIQQIIIILKNIIRRSFKTHQLWSSAGIKPMSNDLVHAMPRQCMFALSLHKYYFLCDLMSLEYSLKEYYGQA